MKNSIVFCVVSFVLLTSIMLTAGDTKRGDMIVDAVIGDAKNLLPVLASDAASFGVIDYVYSGLVKYDKNLKIVGDAARSWEVSPDGLKITFHVRDDIRWHDGVPLDAYDCLFTYRTYIDPKVPTAYSGDFLETVATATAPDRLTFVVTYKKLFAPALSSWAIPIHPRHLLEGKDVTKSELTKYPIGSGPFRFVEWKTGRHIILSANRDYFLGAPNISRIFIRIIPDTATQFLELQNRSIDEMSLTPLQYARQTGYGWFKAGYSVYSYQANSYVYLGFNLKNPIFADRDIRIALNHAIDKQTIGKVVFLGSAVPAYGPYKPGSQYYSSRVRRYTYDPAKAAAIFARKGFVKGRDGILRRNGKPFEFTILVNNGNGERLRTGLMVQQYLKVLGIKVNLRALEWASLLSFITKRKFEALIMGWSLSVDPDQYDIWHSTQTKPEQFNFVGYANPEVDRLLLSGRDTIDETKRKAIYQRFQEILAEDVPYLFLCSPMSRIALDRRFIGVEPTIAGIGHNFIEWYVPKSLRRYAYTD